MWALLIIILSHDSPNLSPPALWRGDSQTAHLLQHKQQLYWRAVTLSVRGHAGPNRANEMPLAAKQGPRLTSRGRSKVQGVLSNLWPICMTRQPWERRLSSRKDPSVFVWWWLKNLLICTKYWMLQEQGGLQILKVLCDIWLANVCASRMRKKCFYEILNNSQSCHSRVHRSVCEEWTSVDPEPLLLGPHRENKSCSGG